VKNLEKSIEFVQVNKNHTKKKFKSDFNSFQLFKNIYINNETTNTFETKSKRKKTR
jgi:hypothetical protein